MRVKFLRNFGGRETREVHYQAGQEAELSDDVADVLAMRQIVTAVEVVPLVVVAPPKAAPVQAPEPPQTTAPKKKFGRK